ncbi:ABC transporter permease [Planktomarina temperata]|jgi:peptide/nickel transport system permease protein|nr:ABC transporter permease [Planktomarina temperata]MDA8840137.1 ABC transporter permease [bacterium]MDA7455723.1 ABC transporter permease [Planktomarina temperata]MDA8768287.1 ABC transporter permease [Planktomarina temperata]MDA8785239.1 ABC transporter permease [Planktomarina temperata]
MIAFIKRYEGLWLFTRSPAAIIAAIVALLSIMGAAFAPLIASVNPYDLASFSLMDGLLPPMWEEFGISKFPLGTDDQGRDMVSSILYGARLSLIIGLSAMTIATVLGVGLGLAAGYYGGRFDMIVMRIADIQLALPAILTSLLIDGIARGILPSEIQQDLRVAVLTLAIALSLWVNFARTARASTFVQMQKEYVQAAIIMGQRPIRVMFVHILPNILGPLLVIMTVDLASAILLEATLSFLGIGLPADSPSLGTLIRIGMQFMLSGEWWILWIPTLFLVALVVSINILGDFLRDVFNPRLR